MPYDSNVSGGRHHGRHHEQGPVSVDHSFGGSTYGDDEYVGRSHEEDLSTTMTTQDDDHRHRGYADENDDTLPLDDDGDDRYYDDPPYEEDEEDDDDDAHRSTSGGTKDPYEEDYVYFTSGPLDPTMTGGAASNGLTLPPHYMDDSTRTVHEMHHALLYLMTNPDEFAEVVAAASNAGPPGVSDEPGHIGPGGNELPYTVFAPDAEVVLPQALTASQLFGVEQMDGIELEAAAGIVPLSQLFLRWLALMPGGDHMNIIDPPGLTVMRIVGGRYRVTAAHRVVWTWMNEFLPDPTSPAYVTNSNSNQGNGAGADAASQNNVQFGDLVTMTIVDVFETDLDGKLLSYCPTFDNRRVKKTSATVEKLKKNSTKIMERVHIARQSEAGKKVEKAATSMTSMLYQYANKSASIFKGAMKDKMAGGDDGQGGRSPNGADGASVGFLTTDADEDDGRGGHNQNDNDLQASSTIKDALAMGASLDENEGTNEYYMSDDETGAATET